MTQPPDPNNPPGKTLHPGFRFHLSTLFFCCLAASLTLVAIFEITEFQIREQLHYADLSRMTADAAESYRSEVVWSVRLGASCTAIQALMFTIAITFVVCELIARGRNARYAPVDPAPQDHSKPTQDPQRMDQR